MKYLTSRFKLKSLNYYVSISFFDPMTAPRWMLPTCCGLLVDSCMESCSSSCSLYACYVVEVVVVVPNIKKNAYYSFLLNKFKLLSCLNKC